MQGQLHLPTAATGRRETIITSPIEADPQYLQQLPEAGWPPVLAALFTAAFFLLLTVKAVAIALACGALAIVFILVWAWGSDLESAGNVDVGLGVELPTYASGPRSHSWWAVVILMLVGASLYLAVAFSYIYMWTVAPQAWPGSGGQPLPAPERAGAVAVLLVLSSASVCIADKTLARSRAAFALLLLTAVASAIAALAVEVAGHWRSGLRPDASAYGALVYLAQVLQFQVVAAIAIMGGYTLMRLAMRRLNHSRRVTFDNLALLTHYTAGQGLIGVVLVHGFPRAVI